MLPRMLPRSRVISLAILAFFLGCLESGAIAQETYEIRQSGIKLKIKGFVEELKDVKKSENALLNLFDGNVSSGCFLRARDASELQIVFSEPIYLKRVLLRADKATIARRTKLDNLNLAQHVKILAYKDEDEIFAGGVWFYKLGEAGMPKVVKKEEQFLKILKIKYIVIQIDNELENWSNPILWLSEIKLDMGKTSAYTPTLSFSQITEKFSDMSNKWNFSRIKGMSDKKKNEALLSLIYYALHGNNNAEKILYNYSPAQADEGEWASYLMEWYEFTKYN